MSSGVSIIRHPRLIGNHANYCPENVTKWFIISEIRRRAESKLNVILKYKRNLTELRQSNKTKHSTIMSTKLSLTLALVASAAKAQQYTYGNACGGLTDGDCAQVSGCTSCNWSWPSNDPDQWSSSEANCRCMESSGGSNNSSTDYTYGNACGSLTDGQCGQNCTSCSWSWPSNDPDQWASADADCRCEAEGSNPSPSPSNEYTYGSACANLTDGECGTNCNSCAWSWPSDDPQ